MAGQIEFAIGMDYGVGIDDLTGEIRGDGVIGTDPTSVPGAKGQSILFKLDRIETMEQLNEALGVSASANARFGLHSGSAKFSLSEASEFKSYSLYLLVSVAVRNSFKQIRNAKLQDSAANLLREGRVKRFRERLGDSYIRGILTGGEFYGLLEIATQDADEQQEISAELNASKFGTFDVKGQFEQQISAIAKKKNISVKTLQLGGSDKDVPTTADALIERAVTFADTVQGEDSVSFVALSQDYRALDLPQVNLLGIQFAKETLQDLAQLRVMVRSLINNIDFVLTNPNQFKFNSVSKEKLGEDRKQLAKVLNAVTDQALRCSSNIDDCQQLENITIPGLEELQGLKLPERKGAPPVVPRGGRSRGAILRNNAPDFDGREMVIAAKEKPDKSASPIFGFIGATKLLDD